MADAITFHVDGLQDLQRRMATLAADMEQKFAANATGAAAQIVKSAAKAQLRASPSIASGTLERNVIAKKLRANETTLTAEHIVTIKKRIYPRQGRRKALQNTRQIATYKEYGTVHNPPEPFLRPAIDHNITQAIDAMKNSIEADLAKAGA